MNLLKQRLWIVGAIAAAGSMTLADDVQGPFGTHNGDIFGRARAPGVVVDDVGTLPVAWTTSLTPLGINRVAGRTPMTFDAAGNIYFRESTASNSLASFTPAGTLRWRANDGTNTVVLGGAAFTSSGVVVGDGDLCYTLASGATPSAYGIRKDNGLIVWTRPLPDPAGAIPWASGTELTPVLYQSKLYVVSQSDGARVFVYQINSATGAIDYSSEILGPTYDAVGSLTLVPNVFGAGQHGLYWNGSSGNGADAIAEVWAVNLNTNTNSASLAWSSNGGHVARSHVIYSPVTNRLYTHTWTDFGAELYTFDPVTGTRTDNQNSANFGHGFYDVGVLGWDDSSIITGSFSGSVVVYDDPGTGLTTDTIYGYEPLWGELRVFGQLVKNSAGDTLLVTGTNSRCTDNSYPARVVVLNLDEAVVSEDGPAYIDDVLIQQGPNGGPYTTVFSDDFNTYTVGDLPPQGGWELDNQAPSGVVPAQLIDDPTASGQGRVVQLDAQGNGGGFNGMYHNFADSTQDEVVITWKQYRTDLTDNMWPYYGNAPNDFAEGWSFQWDQNQKMHPYHFVDNSGAVTMAPDIWQTITVKFSSINDPDPANRTIQVTVTDSNGSTTGFPVLQTDGFNATASIRGWGTQIEGTALTSGGTPNTAAASHNTGICQDHGFTTRGGPVAGPDGKIYYQDPVANTLVALGVGSACPGSRGDVNCDGLINFFDIDPFLLALFDLPTYQTTYCGGDICAADIDCSGAIDFFDIDPMLGCLFTTCPSCP
jgi:hypothetical protein